MQIGQAHIYIGRLIHLDLSTRGEPRAVVVRQRHQAVLRIGHRGLVVGNTELQLDVVGVAVVSAEGVAPGIAELRVELLRGATHRHDVHLRDAAPARPRDVAEQLPAIVQGLGHTQDEGVGQLHVRRSTCPGVDTTGVGHVPPQLMLDRGPVGHPDLGGRAKREQRPHVPAPGVVCRRKRAGGSGQREASRRRDARTPRIFDLHALETHASAEGNLVVDAPRHARVDVVGLDVELDRMGGANPGIVVLGHQTKRRAETDPGIDILGQRPRHVGVGQKSPAARIAAVARIGEGADARPLVLELEGRPHEGEPHRHLPVLQLGHPRRVEEDRTGVLGHRGRAGVGVADAAGVLFEQLEAGSGGLAAGEARGQQGHQAGNGLHFHGISSGVARFFIAPGMRGPRADAVRGSRRPAWQ